MPTIDIRNYPRTSFDELSVTGASASTVLRQKATSSAVPTIPTAAGTTAISLIAPVTGTLTAAKFVAKDTLATHATNLVTFALSNKSNSSAAMLAATAANTSNSTGGSAVTAYTTRTLTLNGTAANLAVTAGDCLEFTVTGGGTLANTITQGNIQLLFNSVL